MGTGARVAQACLVAFNFIFVLLGLAGIITGSVLRVKYDDYINLTSKNVGSLSILLIILGGVIFIVAFLGCCGAMKKSTVMLSIYIFLLSILLIVEIAAVIAAYVYKDKLKGYVKDGMDNALDKFNDDKYKKAFDTVQKEFDCCGAEGPSDYKKRNNTKLPDSCCKPNKTCVFKNGTIVMDNYYQNGCCDKLFDYLENHLAIIGGLAVAVTVIQIIGIIFACIVRRDVKEGYNYV